MQKLIKAHDQEFHYLEFGKKNQPTLLCLHGYTDTSSSFIPLAQKLESTHKTIALDLPMVHNPNKNYDLIILCQYLESFINLLGLKSFDLIGFSISGPIAIKYSQLHPKQVKHLYLLNTSPRLITKPFTRSVVKALQKISLNSKISCSLYATVNTLQPLRKLLKLPRRDRFTNKFIRRHSYSIFSTLFSLLINDLTQEFENLPLEKTIVITKDDKLIRWRKFYPFLSKLNAKLKIFDRGGHNESEAYWNNLLPLFRSE